MRTFDGRRFKRTPRTRNPLSKYSARIGKIPVTVRFSRLVRASSSWTVLPRRDFRDSTNAIPGRTFGIIILGTSVVGPIRNFLSVSGDFQIKGSGNSGYRINP